MDYVERVLIACGSSFPVVDADEVDTISPCQNATLPQSPSPTGSLTGATPSISEGILVECEGMNWIPTHTPIAEV